MIYPHLFINRTTGKSIVMIALSDLTVADTAWLGRQEVAGIHEVFVPSVDLVSETHEFDTEAQALQYIKSWWATREDVTSLTPFTADQDQDDEDIPPQLHTRYFVTASTGCSCCRSDNRIFGPFLTEESAVTRAKSLHASKYVASQYSANGRYNPFKIQLEELADGRLIWGDKVILPEEGQELGHPDDYDTYSGQYLATIE